MTKEINKLFPLGGLNRVDVALRLDTVVLYNQLLLFKQLRDANLTEGLETKKIVNDLVWGSKLLGAYCGEMAHVSVYLIQKEFPEVNAEIVRLKLHEMVVIGRASDSKVDDIATWGDEAIICDPWANRIYPCSKFLDEKRSERKIPFINWAKRVVHEDYLEGEPKVHHFKT